jgi:hypothetical protein
MLGGDAAFRIYPIFPGKEVCCLQLHIAATCGNMHSAKLSVLVLKRIVLPRLPHTLLAAVKHWNDVITRLLMISVFSKI